MTNKDGYELTTSLSIEGGTPELLDDYARRIEEALVAVLRGGGYAAVVAYFARANHDSYEVEIGLRFEGMEPRYIEDAADDILEETIESVTPSPAGGPAPVREESTLVPA